MHYIDDGLASEDEIQEQGDEDLVCLVQTVQQRGKPWIKENLFGQMK